MTTGSLKLMSLLVVIAAGGGVAWQVQQGLLHPKAPAVDATADRDSEFSDDASPDPFANKSDDTVAIDGEPSDNTETLTRWGGDEDHAPRRTAGAPGKFQRTTKPERSLGSAIPPRLAANDQPDESDGSSSDLLESSDPETSASDPFHEQAEPADELGTAADNSPRRTKSSAIKPEAADPFDDSPPVMLVGNENAEEPAAADELPSLTDSQTADSDDDSSRDADVDDPFAGAAPPDLSHEKLRDKGRESPTDSDLLDDESSSGPSLFPSRRGKPEKSSARSPKRQALSSETEPIPARESTDLQPKLGKPTDSPIDSFGEELPSKLDEAPAKTSPRRSRPSPKGTEDMPDDPAPRLLPVPDATLEKSSPRLPTDLDLHDRDKPNLGGFGPKDMPLKDDELNGDGTFDRDAPQGLQQPRLTIEKIAPKQAVVGQPLIYSVVVKNAGSADAHHVTVEDRIPKGTKLEGTSPRAELIDKRLVWKLGTLKPDEQKKISIKLIPLEQGPIGSVAKVNFVAEIATEIEVTAPQILVSIDAPSQVRLGDKLHLVFKIRNAGGADAQNVVVRNLIPDGLRHPAGADLEYAMGTLPAQDSREIKLDLIATKNGKVTNKTIITADGVKFEEETPVEVIGEQLLLTRTGNSRLFVDKPAVFTSTVANEGTAAAAKVMVAEVVPAGLEFVSASDNGQYDPATRAVTWSVGPIGPGEELKLSTKLMPKDLGDYRATVTVTGPAGSVATVDAELKIDGFPALAVESKSNARLISVGEKATIRITCKNQGTAAAKNLIFSAALPPELKLVDGNGPSEWARQGNVITFEAISHLDPDESATFDIQVEGVAEGDTRIETQISADSLKRPLRRDEDIRIAP